MKNNKATREEREELQDDLAEEEVEDPKEEDQVENEESETEAESEAEEEEEEEELNVKYLRLAADFQNYRRRVDKEKNDIYAYANEKIMTELLEVIDNFDRALAIDSQDTGLKEGMEMIFKQFMGVLKKSGLEEIPAEDEEFDPNFHHAVQMENNSGQKSGTITNVLTKGYMLNKKVIRPSMVIVAE